MAFTEEGMSKQENTQAKLQNAIIPINRLPIEIFIVILNLALPSRPTWRTPYPCMPFSWVCHHWRSVVLGYPFFWKVIVSVGEEDMADSFIKEIVIRSRPVPLEVVVSGTIPIHDMLSSDANRVAMLRMNDLEAHLSLPDVVSSFPLLKKIFYRTRTTTDFPDKSLPHLQALRVSIRNLGNLTIPKNFPNLWWLHLKYNVSLPLIPLLEALHNLPNLRVLHLFPSEYLKLEGTFSMFTKPIITFHQLEVLITRCPLLQLITAPKLTYFDITEYPVDLYRREFNHFCGFDFSQISHIRADMCYSDCLPIYLLGMDNPNDDSDSDDLCPSSFERRRQFRSQGVFNEICPSYPHGFYIEFDYQIFPAIPWPPLVPTYPIAAILGKTKNLEEIILDNCDPLEWPYEWAECFKMATRATTATKLTLLGCDFPTFCNLLRDETVCPRLETLTQFSHDYFEHESSYALDSLPNLINEDSTTCPTRPLTIVLEGFRFPPIPADELEPFEKLGLRIIQNEHEVATRFNIEEPSALMKD